MKTSRHNKSFARNENNICLHIFVKKFHQKKLVQLKMQNKSIYHEFLKVFQLLSINYEILSPFGIGVGVLGWNWVRVIFLNILKAFDKACELGLNFKLYQNGI